METQRWVNLGLILGGGLVFLFLSRLLSEVWMLTALPQWSSDMPVGPEVPIAFLLAISVAIGTRYWSQANRFFNEVVVELAKVTWPVRKETVSSSGVVLALVGVAALLLAFLDFIWGTMARQVFSF